MQLQFFGTGNWQKTIAPIACSCVVFLIAIILFGGLQPLMQFARGKRIYLQSRNVDLGHAEKPTLVELDVENIAFSDVSIVGVSSNCNCYSIQTELPIKLASGKQIKIQILYTPPGNAGDKFSNQFALISDRVGEKYFFEVFGIVKPNFLETK